MEYKRLATFEERYWWYRAVRESLVETVRSLELPPEARILDAGCGSGRHLEELIKETNLDGYGLDYSTHAAALWERVGTSRRCVGSINALPFGDERFHAAVCVDVLQMHQVDPMRALRELVRVVRPGGPVVLMVPAHQWLLSKHDEAVRGVRRFNRRTVRSMASAAGLRVVRLLHLFPTFFPAIATVRLLRKAVPRRRGPVRSDLFALPAWLNTTLLGVARVERAVLRRWDAPFGTSIFLVGRRSLT